MLFSHFPDILWNICIMKIKIQQLWFFQEQISEREQEREEHQREIDKLQETIEDKSKNAGSQERLQREVSFLIILTKPYLINYYHFHKIYEFLN